VVQAAFSADLSGTGAPALPCQANALRTIVSMSEWCGD